MNNSSGFRSKGHEQLGLRTDGVAPVGSKGMNNQG